MDESAPTKQSTIGYYDVLVADSYKDRDSGEDRTAWTRVGVAFPHKDHEGLNVTLTAFPISGKLVIKKHIDSSDS